MTPASAIRALEYVIAVLEEKTITKHAREMALKQLRAVNHALNEGYLEVVVDTEHADSSEV